MAQNLKSKKKSKFGLTGKFKTLLTEKSGNWAIAEETRKGCHVITESSTTFIPDSFLVDMVDDSNNSMGWMIERNNWECQ